MVSRIKTVFFLIFLCFATLTEVSARPRKSYIAEACSYLFGATPQSVDGSKRAPRLKWVRRLTGTTLLGTTLLLVGGLVPSNAEAGWISIDKFTDSIDSDGLGRRSGNGTVWFAGPDGIALGRAELIAGYPPSRRIAEIHYSFVPTPLVVKPIVLVTARNMQTSPGETGVLRARINGGPSISYELSGNQTEFMQWSFDFTSHFLNGSETPTISHLIFQWIVPEGDTGVRQLWVSSIDVEEVPEPATLALMGVAGAGALISKRRNVRRIIVSLSRGFKPLDE